MTKPKLKKYYIQYFFDGKGTSIVKATSEREAREKWYAGDYISHEDDETGENYTIEEVQEDN